MKHILIILFLVPVLGMAQQKITISAVGVDAITTDTSHLSDRINARVKYTDTAAMLAPYARTAELPSGSGVTKTRAPLIISGDSIYQRYNVLAYGLKGDGVTDDAAALNALLVTAKAAGGTSEIYFPYTGHSYIIAGALQTADSCQVCIPLTDTANMTNAPHIILRGEGKPNTFTDWGLASKNEPSKGVIIESTSTKQLGSVFGSVGSVGSINGNFTQVSFENLWIKVRSKNGSTHVAPAMTAIDASGLEMVEITHCRIETQSPQDSSVTPLSTAYGVKTPAVNNWAHVIMHDVLIQNFYYGLQANEHLSADNITISTCYNGVRLITGFHAVEFKKLNLFWNRNQITIDGTSYFLMHNVDFEEYNPPSNPSVCPTQWFNTVNDILENSGASKGEISYQRTVANVGTNNTLISNGSASILTSNIGTNNGVFGAGISVSGEATFTATAAGAGFDITATNATAGANARARFLLVNNSGGNASLEKLSSTAATTGITGANDLVLRNATNGNLDIYSSAASSKIQFATAGSSTAQMTLNANGTLNITVSEYADNAAAVSAGLAVGTIYRTGDTLKIVH